MPQNLALQTLDYCRMIVRTMWSCILPTHCYRTATTLTSSSKLHDSRWMCGGNSHHRPYLLSWEFLPNFKSVCQKELLPFQYSSDIDWETQLRIQCPEKVGLGIKKIWAESHRGRFVLFFLDGKTFLTIWLFRRYIQRKISPLFDKDLVNLLLKCYDTFQTHPCCLNMSVLLIHHYCCPEFFQHPPRLTELEEY